MLWFFGWANDVYYSCDKCNPPNQTRVADEDCIEQVDDRDFYSLDELLAVQASHDADLHSDEGIEDERRNQPHG